MFTLLLKQLITVLLAGIAGLVVILVVPFDSSHRIFHWVAQTFSQLVLKLFGVQLEVKGVENVQPGQPYVYVANHASMFDIPAAIVGVPDRIHLIYKKELEKIPLFGWGLKLSGAYIGIDRGRGRKALKSLERAIQKIRNGASVLLFAEGTRTRDGKLQSFKRGAFSLAMKAGVSIIPLTINGSYKILPRDVLRINPGTITLVLDRPIDVSKWDDGREGERKLMEEVHTVLEKHYIDQ